MAMSTSPSSPATTRKRPDSETLSRVRTGQLIRDARTYEGLTQQELAERLGTSQSAISAWESGRENLRVATLARILRACGFEASLLLRHRDDVDQSQIALHLAMTPAQRVAHHESGVRAIGRAHRATRISTNA